MKSAAIWGLLIALAIGAAIVLPYLVLSGNAAHFDVALLWLGFGVAVIALIAAGLARWRL